MVVVVGEAAVAVVVRAVIVRVIVERTAYITVRDIYIFKD